MTGPLRPVFTEGQILTAADLSTTVGYARAADTRHQRYLHDWGIADGLTLATENRTDPATNARFVEVSVQPGLAVDGTGREIVVPAPVVLSEAEFREVNGADLPTPTPYPVFLTAADRAQSATGPASCAGATGSAPTMAIFENSGRRKGLVIAGPPLREKKLPHRPCRASGMTGTGLRSRMRVTPGRKGLSSPVAVMLPSGKMPTSSPSSSARATSSKARSIIAVSSLAGAMGIARVWRKMNEMTGVLKMRWSMTKRIGRGDTAIRMTGSTKLT